MFGYSVHCDWESLSEKEQDIAYSLPHGSGIDYDWTFERLQNGKIVFSNAYHFMNECGMYVGSLDFSVTVDVDDPMDFRLTFNGLTSTGYRWVDRLGLRDYLEDTLAFCFDNLS